MYEPEVLQAVRTAHAIGLMVGFVVGMLVWHLITMAWRWWCER